MCGVAPKERPSFTFNVFVLTFIAGQSIIITLIFKGGSIYTTTKNCFNISRGGQSKVHVLPKIGSNNNSRNLSSINFLLPLKEYNAGAGKDQVEEKL